MSLTDEELKLALAHINLEQQPPTLPYLHKLMLHFVGRIPFENLSLHYAASPGIKIDLPTVFNKIIVNSRGGYCMELNALFAALMRTLGYDLYTIGGRVRSGQPTYTATTHMAIITTIDSLRYIVDVGYGGEVSLQPMLMEPHDFSIPLNRSGRLEYRPIYLNTVPGQNSWVYSVKDGQDGEWKEQYALTDVELVEKDFEMMNWFTSTNSTSFFATGIVVLRVVLEGEEVKAIHLVYNDGLRRRNQDGTKDDLATFKSESERVSAFEKYFDIVLSEEDTEAIKSTRHALAT